MSTRSDLRALRRRHQDTLDALDDAVTENAGLLETITRKCREITVLSDEVDTLRRELAEATTPDAGWLSERRDLKRRNLILTQTVRGLEQRLHTLQQANEAMCRDAADRAGTLRKVEVPA